MITSIRDYICVLFKYVRLYYNKEGNKMVLLVMSSIEKVILVLNKRQEKVVLIMDSNKQWITGKELSNILNVSDRTIRSDIDHINKHYGETLIESNLRYGYRLNYELFTKLNIEFDNITPQTPAERCVYIIQALLFEKHELNLMALQDQVFVSGYSIDNDLKRIKKILEPYSNLKLVRSKNFIRLEGSEESKRKLYKELLAEETQGNFLNLNRLAAFYKTFDLLEVKQILEETFEEYHFHVREMAFPMLMLHVGIAIERILRHNFIHTDRKNDVIQQSVEYQIASKFFTKVARKIRIEIVEDEIVLLTLLLLGKKSTDYTQDLVHLSTGNYSLQDLVEGMLNDLKEAFDIDFTQDMELKVGLQMHIQSLIERHLKHVNVNNVYLEEIKRKYPLVFEMGIRVGRYMEEVLNMKISESEVGFIALHLGSAYERLNLNRKYRVVMIYPNDQALSNLCVQKVNNRFYERLEIVECMNFFEEQMILKHKPDLILTTLPLKHHLEIPTLQISLFINFEDESRIFQALNSLDKHKFQFEFISKITTLIDDQFFYTNVEAKAPEDIICFMCDRLYDQGYVDEGFKDAVLLREEMSATSFAYSFAIPHTMNVSAKKSNLSVAILKKPILWGSYDVKLVILLAIHEEDNTLMKLFFDWLSNAVSDSRKFASLLDVKTHEEFIEQMME